MINITKEPDGSLTISWDENDPQESILNNWTEEDFLSAIKKNLDQLSQSS